MEREGRSHPCSAAPDVFAGDELPDLDISDKLVPAGLPHHSDPTNAPLVIEAILTVGLDGLANLWGQADQAHHICASHRLWKGDSKHVDAIVDRSDCSALKLELFTLTGGQVAGFCEAAQLCEDLCADLGEGMAAKVLHIHQHTGGPLICFGLLDGFGLWSDGCQSGFGDAGEYGLRVGTTDGKATEQGKDWTRSAMDSHAAMIPPWCRTVRGCPPGFEEVHE